MTTATLAAPTELDGRVYDIALENDISDENLAACRFGDGEPATHVCAHDTCRMLLCPKHAATTQLAINTAITEGVLMWCSVCHGSGLDPHAIVVRAI